METVMAQTASTSPALAQSLIFNPHIIWDPPPWPWLDQVDPAVGQEVMLIRLQAQKQILEIQAKALDQAIGALSKAQR
jgi:hypothetical protein